MKKLILFLVIATASGCSNPISSKVGEEGDETRYLMQNELATAKVEISEELRHQFEALLVEVSGRFISLFDLLQSGGVIRR